MVISFEGDECRARVQSEVRQRSDTLDRVPRHAVIQAVHPDKHVDVGSLRREETLQPGRRAD